MQINGIEELVKRALLEDIGTGDVTTLSTVQKHCVSLGCIVAKEDFIVCGLPVLAYVFQQVDPCIKVTEIAGEGAQVKKGDVLATMKGPSQGILTGERTALNFLQRLSGIATKTWEAVKQVEGLNTQITDTRKTTPGMRELEKYAVRTGGGVNHRTGLFDGVLIKDNHICAAGSITAAIEQARKRIHHLLKIEVEVENFAQLEEAIQAGADTIMLDNMGLADMKKAVGMVAGRALIEASGNMDRQNLHEVASTGVNLISIGALTHSARAVDISLRLECN